MSLSERLAELRPIVQPALPSFIQLERTIRQILDRFDAPPHLPEKDAERLFHEMRRRISGNDWHKVPMSFVTRVAALVFAAAHRLREDLADLRRFFYREIIASDRPGFLNPMVRIYIESYQAGAHHTAELARGLAQSRQHIGAHWQHVLKNFPELLDPVRAPAAIAVVMDGMDSPWQGLREKGLRQPHAPGRWMPRIWNLSGVLHPGFVTAVKSTGCFPGYAQTVRLYVTSGRVPPLRSCSGPGWVKTHLKISKRC